MPTFTIYSLGDTSSYWSMLNGVAMLFGQTGFWSSAALTGSLMLLVLVLVNMLASSGGGKGGHSPVLGPLYFGATVVLMSINSSVVVQDIYTGSVVQVDNIPLIIALPSSISTTAAYKVFQYADTAFQSVDGSYMSVSANGMVSPLQSLLSMRKGFATSSPALALTISGFAKDCIVNSGFKPAEYKIDKNSIGYLLTPGHYTPSNLTFDYPASGSNPTSTNCGAEATVLQARIAAYIAGGSVEGKPDSVVAGNMVQYPKADKTPVRFADAEVAVQNIIATHLRSSAQQSTDIMQNMLFYDVINSGMDCAGVGASPATVNDCYTSAAVLRQAQEQWKANSAGAGTLFTKIMTPAITFMQLMFFGFSPLVLLACLFMGEKSLGLFSKYLIFGVWTVSWLPFSCVIQMYIQNQLANRIAALSTATTGGGIVAGNMSNFYDVVSTNLALASDLLAATPMISFALLTGSSMAMTGLASRWSAEQHVDQKAVAPSLQSVGPVHQQAAVSNGDSLSNRFGGNENFSKISVGSTLSESTASAVKGMQQTQAATANQYSNVKTLMEQKGSSLSSKTGVGAEFSEALQKNTTAQQSLADASKVSTSFGQGSQQAIKNGLTLGAKLLGNGVSIDKSSLSTADRKETEAWENTYNSAQSAANQASSAVGVKATAAVESMATHATGETKQKATTLSTSMTETQSRAKEFAQTIGSDKTAGITRSIDSDKLGTMISGNGAATKIADDKYLNMSDIDRRDVDAMARENIGHGRTSGAAARYEAIAVKLASQGKYSDIDDINSAIVRAPTGDSNMNEGVGSNAGNVNPVSPGAPSRGMDASSVAGQTVSQGGFGPATVGMLPSTPQSTVDAVGVRAAEMGVTANIDNVSKSVPAALIGQGQKAADQHKAITGVTGNELQGSAIMTAGSKFLQGDKAPIVTKLGPPK